MSYRSFITIVITAAALTSCTLTRSYHCDSYVQQYYNMEGLSLSLDHEQDSVWVNLNGAEVSFAGSFISKGEEKQVYDRLCEKNNDLGFDREVVVIDDKFVTGYSFNINSISITSDKDWDEAHPAGSSLADVFVVKFRSAEKYINSSYSGDIPVYMDLIQSCPLSELESGIKTPLEYTGLIAGQRVYCRLGVSDRLETANADHMLRVKLSLDNGQSYTSCIVLK